MKLGGTAVKTLQLLRLRSARWCLIVASAGTMAAVPIKGLAWEDVEPEIKHSDLMHGWTWTLMPKVPFIPPPETEGIWAEPEVREAEVDAIALEGSNSFLVGGVLMGPFRIGRRFVGRSNKQQGFIARVDASRKTSIVQVFGGVSPGIRALKIDSAGAILGASENRGLFKITRSGRFVWVKEGFDWPTAIALTAKNDVMIGGCDRWKGPEWYPGATRSDEIGSGYIARVSSTGKFQWRFEFGESKRVPRPRTCVTDVVIGPDDDVFVGGIFFENRMVLGADTLRRSDGHQFVARFSGAGAPKWARVLPFKSGATPLVPAAERPGPEGSAPVNSCLEPIKLAPLPSGEVAIAGEIVDSAFCGTAGLAVIGKDGTTRWLLPVEGLSRTDAFREVKDAVVASTGREIFWAGSFRRAIRIGGRSLPQPAGVLDGAFLARVGEDGGVTSLERIPTKRPSRSRIDPGRGATPTAIVAQPKAVWIVGNVGAASSAFAYRVLKR